MTDSVEAGTIVRSFGAHLDKVVAGESFIITRHGRAVAYLTAIPNPDPRLERELEEIGITVTAPPDEAPPEQMVGLRRDPNQAQRGRDELLHKIPTKRRGG